MERAREVCGAGTRAVRQKEGAKEGEGADVNTFSNAALIDAILDSTFSAVRDSNARDSRRYATRAELGGAGPTGARRAAIAISAGEIAISASLRRAG